MSCIHCVNWMRQMSSVKRNSCNLIKRSIWIYSYTRVLKKPAQQILILARLPSMCLSSTILIILQATTIPCKPCLKCSHVLRKLIHSKRKKKNPAILRKGIVSEAENTILLPCCTFSSFWVFFRFDNCLSENTYYIKERYRDRQWDIRMVCVWKHNEQAPETKEKLTLSASVHPNMNYTGPSKQWLLTIPHDKKNSNK